MKTRKLLAVWTDIKERNAPGFVYAVIAFVYVILGGRVTLWMLAFTSDVLKNIHMFECIFFSLLLGIALLALTLTVYFLYSAIYESIEKTIEWWKNIG